MESCSFPPAALFDVGDTIWKGERGRERERRGEHTNASPLGLHKIHLDFSESRFLSSVATVRWICNVQYNGYFSLKKMSILLAKQSPRTSKMATRNTSSSDALLDGSPAHLACDRSRAAARGLWFAEARCLSKHASFTTSGITAAGIGLFRKVKGQTEFCFTPPSSTTLPLSFFLSQGVLGNWVHICYIVAAKYLRCLLI